MKTENKLNEAQVDGYCSDNGYALNNSVWLTSTAQTEQNILRQGLYEALERIKYLEDNCQMKPVVK